MNCLERAWLNRFVAQYQQITTQIERHEAYLEELLETENRIRSELEYLELQKESVLNQFADTMLRNSTKDKPLDEKSSF